MNYLCVTNSKIKVLITYDQVTFIWESGNLFNKTAHAERFQMKHRIMGLHTSTLNAEKMPLEFNFFCVNAIITQQKDLTTSFNWVFGCFWMVYNLKLGKRRQSFVGKCL